jgi:hypothetical protein
MTDVSEVRYVPIFRSDLLVYFSETLVPPYKSIRRYNPEDQQTLCTALRVVKLLRSVFNHKDEDGHNTYSLSRTLLKNCIVERCSSFPSGPDGFSSHELLNPAPSAVLRSSSNWSGSEKQVGAMGRDCSAGRADSWLAVRHRPERLHRTLWTPRIRLTRCRGFMVRNSVLEKHSGSPSEKAKHINNVQLARCSTKQSCNNKGGGYLK